MKITYKFSLWDKQSRENGDSEEKSFYYEFAKSFKDESNDSLDNLNNIKGNKHWRQRTKVTLSQESMITDDIVSFI